MNFEETIKFETLIDNKKLNGKAKAFAQ